MIQHSDDRRARRSRKLMKEGLLELMREKPFSAITAREVTDRMDLNRGTFYLHYRDTGALLHSIESDLLADAQQMIDESRTDGTSATLQALFRTVLDYIAANREVFHTLLANDSSRFVERMQALILKNGGPVIRSRFPDVKDDALQYLLSFLTYGLMGLIVQWFRSGMSVDRETLVRAAEHMVSGASVYLLR